MASHSAEECSGNSINDGETDYGSDFSLEDAEILFDLASGKQQFDIADNPIVTEIEHHEKRTLRIPRTLCRESKSPLFQAAVAAGEAAQQISNSIQKGTFTDCKNISLNLL
jgi:exonuclease V